MHNRREPSAIALLAENPLASSRQKGGDDLDLNVDAELLVERLRDFHRFFLVGVAHD